jgi:hypothetical protein
MDFLPEHTPNLTTFQCVLMVSFRSTFYWMHQLPLFPQSAMWTLSGVLCQFATTPNAVSNLFWKMLTALADAEDVQWRIYAQQEIWRLQDHPLYHGHQDGRIIVIRAVQGHSGSRVNVSLFTGELHLEDEELPLECIHGTQGPLESIIRHGLIPGGLSPSGATPVRARDMIHFAVSLPSRPRGLPQLAALHRHRRFMISFDLPAWLEDSRRASLTGNDVMLVRDVIPAGFFLSIVDQVTGQDVLPNFRVERFGPE